MFNRRKKTEKPEEQPMQLPVEEETAVQPAEQTMAEEDENREEDEDEEVQEVQEDRGDEDDAGEPPLSLKDTLAAGFEGWSEGKDIDAAAKESVGLLIGMISVAAEEGTVDEALYEMLFRAAYYDKAVAEAGEAGEVRGRNARIDELIREEEEDDGVPHPGTGGAPDVRTPNIFDLARAAW